jgi:hypothetical protein
VSTRPLLLVSDKLGFDDRTYLHISVTLGEPDHAMESMGIMNIMTDRGFLASRPLETPNEFTSETAHNPDKVKDWLHEELQQELQDDSIVVTVVPFK